MFSRMIILNVNIANFFYSISEFQLVNSVGQFLDNNNNNSNDNSNDIGDNSKC